VWAALETSLKDIDVLILTGGKGTRLQPVVNDRPKPMAEVNGVPFLDIILKYLYKQGLGRFILCTGHMSSYIEQYYSEKSFGFRVIMSKEKVPLGTGGAIKHAEHLIRSGPFFVLNGDSYCEIDYDNLLQFHFKKNALITITASGVKNTIDYSKTVLDENDRIVGFLNNKTSQDKGYVNAGIYCMSQSTLNLMPANISFSLEKDFIPTVLNHHQVFAYKTDLSFTDIGTSERYQSIKGPNRERNVPDTFCS
jgi:NDP-sugar pyrophosphorylase family protein